MYVFQRLFYKGNRKHVNLFSLSYRNTCGSLGDAKNCLETLALSARACHAISITL